MSVELNCDQQLFRNEELAMTQQSTVSSLLHFRVIAIALSRNRYRTIASSCYCFVVPFHYRHHIVVAPSHRRHRTIKTQLHRRPAKILRHRVITSSHLRHKPRQYDDAIVNYMTLCAFSTNHRCRTLTEEFQQKTARVVYRLKTDQE